MNRIQANRRDCAIEWFGANLRFQRHGIRRCHLDGAPSTTALEYQLRLPVHPDQSNPVTREDEMRVVDLRIEPPDFRPQPWAFQEGARDIPQRIALDHRIDIRVIRFQVLTDVLASSPCCCGNA